MLLHDAKEVAEKLMRLHETKSNVDEVIVLAGLYRELEGKVGSIRRAVERVILLRAQGIPMSLPDNVGTTKETVRRLAARFNEAPISVTLKQSTRWTTLTGALDALATTLDALQLQDWKRYFNDSLFAGLSPDRRRATLNQNHPGNKASMERYSDLYSRFNKYRNTIPLTVEALNEVRECSDNLSQITFVEVEDMPDSVRRFFDASATSAGAGLALFTDEVKGWLQDHDLIGSYVVRAKA
ncbi:hypothetical protein B0G71_8247 [Paraburkholderia sp. BL27I4N3]|uniref:hypothetical protein n=1 Tax=Paraburkholderia sp. BL27I4N3 TaxID=1938805 RepID=UPI000E21E1DE|nr:hypothetical protein [Paraburkholderia sp. BL27I4N3]REE06567.1 hypothetical protein B0G71_8247 [Paraburkholderia sp. BL27I4N3]